MSADLSSQLEEHTGFSRKKNGHEENFHFSIQLFDVTKVNNQLKNITKLIINIQTNQQLYQFNAK
jgi:hypothetical protein